MNYLALFLMAIAAGALGLTLWGMWLVVRHFGWRPSFSDFQTTNSYAKGHHYPPVSILKPVKGLDPGLIENLTSFFNLNFQDFELLFSVADSKDPAIRVIENLMAQFPIVKSQLLIGDNSFGPNPKVNNLVRGFDQAKHEWVLISDANVRVTRDYLYRLFEVVDENTGVVTAVVRGVGPESPGAWLESTFLNTFYARWMMLADALGKPCVVGKTMLINKTICKRFGGLNTIGQFLAEDFQAGEAVRYLNLQVKTMKISIPQILGNHTIGDFWKRHIRWGRIRKAQAPLAFMAEPLFSSIGGVVVGAIGICLSSKFSTIPWFICSYLSIWCFADLVVVYILRGPISVFYPFYWFIREILHLPLWVHIASGHDVNWRGQSIRIGRGGLIEKAKT